LGGRRLNPSFLYCPTISGAVTLPKGKIAEEVFNNKTDSFKPVIIHIINSLRLSKTINLDVE
jgi:hypothetical protein